MLTQAVAKSPAGGDYLSAQCGYYLTEKGIEIVPPYLVKSKEITKAEEPANFKRRVFRPKLTDSWQNYMIRVMFISYTDKISLLTKNYIFN